MADTAARYRANWQDEIESAALYMAIAAAEPNPSLAEVYHRLAGVEAEHARFWDAQLRAAGQPVPPHRLGWRTRTLIWLVRCFGPAFVLPTIGGLERMDSRCYAAQPESRATALPGQERSHARVLQLRVHVPKPRRIRLLLQNRQLRAQLRHRQTLARRPIVLDPTCQRGAGAALGTGWGGSTKHPHRTRRTRSFSYTYYQ